jgi:hypothetical protein
MARTSQARSKLSSFVATGEDLYKRAEKIVDQSPKTERDVDLIVVSIGNQWSVDEHAFQEAFWPMRRTDLPGDVREGITRIGQFDNFIFHAVMAAYSCHNADAHWTLKIAGEILAHAKMASEGHPDPDWDPDLDSAPEDHAKCRE